MSRAALLALLLPAAAPVPKERSDDRLARFFGKVVAADKDCEVELLPGDRLRVRLPGKAYSLDPSPVAAAAPRIVREVDGDFVFQVRVSQTVDPSAGPAVRGATPQVAAGLLLRSGDDVSASIERNDQATRTGAWQSGIRLSARSPSSGLGSSTGSPFDAKPVGLRLSRTGSKVTGEYSTDGKTWRRLTETDLPLGPTVTVGLYATGTADAAFEAVFDEFSLTPAKAGGPPGK
jgi:regulation of enolase protein 1 (concanavalin A-like superfamily)